MENRTENPDGPVKTAGILTIGTLIALAPATPALVNHLGCTPQDSPEAKTAPAEVTEPQASFWKRIEKVIGLEMLP